ncbi:MAG: sugar phosphate isomerase/epimerase family protein [Planctomycetaceae bacterium]
MNRREFLASASAGLALATHPSANATPTAKQHKICAFTKPFNSLSFDQLTEQMALIGFDGIEAPIRPGGHVEPKQVPDKLPELVEALKKQNLELTVLASNINDASRPLTESVLKTAAKLGIKRYRMQYFKYDLKKPIKPQIENWKSQVRELAALNKELGLTGLYQNHAGRNYLGAAIWDLPMLLDGIDPAHIGVAYDIRHATVEGGTSWPVSFQMVQPHISMVYVKDFQWGEGTKPENVPLGQGRIDATQFLKLLSKSGYNGPISLHEEYLDHRKPDLVPQHLAAFKKDLGVLKAWLAK